MPLGFANGTYLAASGTRSSFASASAQLEREGHPAIVVNWGDREYQTQVDVFLERYVTAANVRGRKVYSTATWNGTRYYRISNAGVVAPPSPTAPHVARRAADLAYPYNTNTAARRRLVQIAPAHDLTAAGDNFGEPWHFEKKGSPGAVTGSAASVSVPAPAPARPSEEDDDMNDGPYRIVIGQAWYLCLPKPGGGHHATAQTGNPDQYGNDANKKIPVFNYTGASAEMLANLAVSCSGLPR